MASALPRTEHTAPEQSTAPLRIAVIVGSIRADRFGPTPATWVAGHARAREDVEVDLIDLAEHDLPAILGGNDVEAPQPPSVTALGRSLAPADAFVVVTPVYNRSYPASLKNAVDWFYSEWQLKPVGFVSYGGRTGGLQAVDALHTVFTEFHAVPLRDALMFADFWECFDHDGHPVDVERTSARADAFLDQLAWWALTLRQARAERPYPAGDVE